MKDRNMNDNILERVDPSRRSFLKRVLGASFAAPLIATFAAEEIWIDSANAFTNMSNMTNMTNMANMGLDPGTFWPFAADGR